MLNDEKVKLYGSQLWNKPAPDGVAVEVKGAELKGIVHPEGLLIPCKDGSMVCFVYLLIIRYFQIFKYKLSNTRKSTNVQIQGKVQTFKHKAKYKLSNTRKSRNFQIQGKVQTFKYKETELQMYHNVFLTTSFICALGNHSQR